MSATTLKGRAPMIFAPLATSLSATGLPAATFTRASAATYIDPADGLLKTAAANVPRFEKNGLLLEPQSTNHILNSQDLTSWPIGGATIDSNCRLSPLDGTYTADKIVEDTSSGNGHVITNAISPGVQGDWVLSAYLCAGERGYALLYATGMGGAFFNLATGAYTLYGAAEAAGAEYVNGWWRCWVRKTACTPSNPQIYTSPDGASFLHAGTSGYGIYAWGAQLEAAPAPTSYIPTTSSSVTRSADSVSWPLPDSLRAVLSIDRAWSMSYQNQVGATFGGANNLCVFSGAAYAKFTGLDISPYASSGKMIILRDSAGKIAWGYLGAVASTTGCAVFCDPGLATQGWVAANGFNASDTAYTFDIVNACKAEGTVELMFTPGCVPPANTYPGILTCNGPSGFSSLMYHTSVGSAVAYDGTNLSAIDEAPVGGQQILTATRFSSLTRQLRVSRKRAGALSHGSLVAFDGAFDLGTLQLACGNGCPGHYKNLAIYRRWLADDEL